MIPAAKKYKSDCIYGVTNLNGTFILEKFVRQNKWNWDTTWQYLSLSLALAKSEHPFLNNLKQLEIVFLVDFPEMKPVCDIWFQNFTLHGIRQFEGNS